MRKPVFPRVLQVCVVVDDLDAYVQRYNDDFGMGPWVIYHFNKDTLTNMTLRGRAAEYSMKVALCRLPNVDWELIEPVGDNNIYAEFLKQHGPGIHHVGLATDDYREVMKEMASRGVYELQGGNFAGRGYSYLDLVGELGIVAEIFDTPPGFARPAAVRTYPPGERGE